MYCKPGDLAIVVPPANPANCGAIVKVLRAASVSEGCGWENFHAHSTWLVESIGRDLIAFSDDGRPLAHYRVRPMGDRILRPVSGLPDTSDTDAEQPIKEVA